MKKVRIIAKQVLLKNIKSFSWWTLILLPVVVFIVMLFVAGNSKNDNKPVVLGVVNQPQLVKSLNSTSSKHLNYKNYQNTKKITKDIKNEKVDGQLILNSKSYNAELKVKERLSTSKVTELNSQLATLSTISNAKKLGLSNQDLNQLMHHPQVSQTTLKNKSGEKDYGIKYVLAQVFAILMYIFLISYAATIAQEIGTEKGSRIEESILITVKAGSQFLGKLIGIAGLILINILIYAVLGLGLYIFRSHLDILNGLSISLDRIPIGFLSEILFFFVIGILEYSVLSAMCGSLVSNKEQISQASMPANLIAMAGYFIFMLNAGNGESLVTSVSNYLPFLSPMVLPGSLALGQVSDVQVFISMGINVVFLVLFLIISMKIYRKNVLIYDDNKLFSWSRLKF